jgi:hypothetical protein
MNIRRLAGVAAATLLLACASPANAGDTILAVTGKITGGDMNQGIEIPLSDLTRFDAILAFKTDGNYMEITDKGPLFIVFSYDDIEEVRNALFYSPSVWQIHSIEIK